MPLLHPREDREALIFPDASYAIQGCSMPQVPPADLNSECAAEEMRHEPLAFLS